MWHHCLNVLILWRIFWERDTSANDQSLRVWDEVHTQQIMHEVLELVYPAVPFKARLEIVVTDKDMSFLSYLITSYWLEESLRMDYTTCQGKW